MKPKMAEVGTVIAKWDYKAENAQELDIKKNERLTLLDDSKDWWKVQNARNESGYVPSNYVKKQKQSILDRLRGTIARSNSKAADSKTGMTPPIARNGNTSLMKDSTNNVDSLACEPIPHITKFNYEARQPDELSLVKGERVTVLEKSSDGWWRGRKEAHNQVGWFPSNYVEPEIEDNDTGMYSTAAVTYACSGVPPLIETALTLYPFSSSNPEELNFDKDERLEILEKPREDPDWWKARNARGEVGLVPRNYVQIVEETETESFTTETASTPQSHSASSLSNTSSLGAVRVGDKGQFRVSGPLADKDWYYGKITRAQCEEILSKYAEDGDFLIRDSETSVSDLFVSSSIFFTGVHAETSKGITRA